ncbi:MAG TPA: heavy metal-binding domain-containing protein [Acidimicrobiales bacterium]|nr:heavy metal-binding domain-containing protein [Acidimicrobiales bacterium]
MPDSAADLPEAVERRLRSSAFTSGLSVNDFAACLHMGLRPVAFVQGFCVMQWSWYGAGSPYMRGANPYSGRGGRLYSESFGCPHGYVGSDHRSWGQNFEQSWTEDAWGLGFGTAYRRMVEEATEAGAHGVIGIIDTSRHLADMGVVEFHLTGTAVVVEGAEAPPEVWTTYLAGQRLAKLIEAGFMPVSVAAAMASVRVWDVCVTEYQLRGQAYTGSVGMRGGFAGMANRSGVGGPGGGFSGRGFGGGLGGYAVGGEIVQLGRAHTAARRVAREHVRSQIGNDTLHGAQLSVNEREIGEGDQEVTCILKGTRVRRFKDFDPLPAPRPTVTLR